MKLSGSMSVRPIRPGFLIPADDLDLVVRVARLSACVWGGRYSPIIPIYDDAKSWWKDHYDSRSATELAVSYVDAFEPDLLIEAVPGTAARLGWADIPHSVGLPRILQLEEFFSVDYRGAVDFGAGVDIVEVAHDLYEAEFKFERRHKRPYCLIESEQNNPFFDVVGGRFPSDQALAYISSTYSAVFSPEALRETAETALRLAEGAVSGPLDVTEAHLEQSAGSGLSDLTLHVFDPSHPGDLVEHWNLRLTERQVIPVNVNWLADHRDFLANTLEEQHRPIPGNSFGTKFHSSVRFARSLSEEVAKKALSEHFGSVTRGAFYLDRPQHPRRRSRGMPRNRSAIAVSAGEQRFEGEVNLDGYVRVPTIAPKFTNSTGRYTKAQWANVFAPSTTQGVADAAIVYPLNQWSPGFPRISSMDRAAIHSEGWVLYERHDIGYALLRPQDGRSAFVEWFKSQSLEAVPSEEGQVAAQLMTSAETLLGCGMFADLDTLQLLNEMAESHAEVSRSGKRVASTSPDRSKHINTVRDHFLKREKRSFGYWNSLDFFLRRPAFRAGLRVQCPNCSHRNWYDLDALSYKLTCSRCLKDFSFSQAPEHLHKVDWYYRVVGPFAVPNYAAGGYSVALTLRTLLNPLASGVESTWTTGLYLKGLDCEIDFAAWYRSSRFGDKGGEPLLVFGEAKSFGRDSITDDVIASLMRVGSRFPGAILVVSSLRRIEDYGVAEIERLRKLARWGRRERYRDEVVTPVVILTAVELLARHGIWYAWKDVDGVEPHSAIDLNDLHELAEQTQLRYLGMVPYWQEVDQERRLAGARTRLVRAIRARGSRR